MNPFKFFAKLILEAVEKGIDPPTGYTVLDAGVRNNRNERRIKAKAAHDYTDKARRRKHDARKALKARRKLGRRHL